MKPSEILSATDLSILQALYVNQHSVTDVCRAFNVDRVYVGRLLRRGHVQEFIQDLETSLTSEYAGLEAHAIQVLRDTLNDERASIRLQAADKLLRVLGRFKDSPVVSIEANEVKYVSVVGTDGGIRTQPSSCLPDDPNDAGPGVAPV